MDEPLQYTHPFPVARSFVLKLDRDADLEGGQLSGRIVHLVSDERADFADAAGLVRGLRALIKATLPHAAHAAAPPAANGWLEGMAPTAHPTSKGAR